MRVFRSAALMTYDTGPTADPWIILAVMSSIVDIESLYRVQCLLLEKKSISQLYTVSGISSMAILCRSMDWRTEWKALLKSRARTITYGLLDNRSVIECRMAISAAVVDPVGLKANWSEKLSEGGGWVMAGYRKFLTMIRSNILLRIGVIEIGR